MTRILVADLLDPGQVITSTPQRQAVWRWIVNHGDKLSAFSKNRYRLSLFAPPTTQTCMKRVNDASTTCSISRPTITILGFRCNGQATRPNQFTGTGQRSADWYRLVRPRQQGELIADGCCNDCHGQPYPSPTS